MVLKLMFDFISNMIKVMRSPIYVHLIYFPWDKKGNLKKNENDFDKGPLNYMKKYVSQSKYRRYEVKMWTLSEMTSFMMEKYPHYYKALFYSDNIKHPTQYVDFCRLLVVYHFGGIYWQYGSKPKVPIDNFIPKTKDLRLFVETIISENFSKKMANEPIRNGKPEELIRIANQIFVSKWKNNKFLEYCIIKSLNNINNYEPKCDYDILYIGANAMISEAYDKYDDKSGIDLVFKTGLFVNISSYGTWRNQLKTS